MGEEVPNSVEESPNCGSDSSDSKEMNSTKNTEDELSDSTGPSQVLNDLQTNEEVSKSGLEEGQLNKPADNEARLEQLEKEHETLKSQYVRIAADFDNFRKRQSRDQDDLRLQLTCTTLSSILPVVDNFDRARQQLDPQGEEAKALHRSYQGLYKQLVDVLKQLGVAPMRVVGQLFDPTLHEAVLREPSNEHKEDIIIEELQRGYHLNGRVLRHALVKVSMGPGASKQSMESSNDNSNDVDENLDVSAPKQEQES